MRKITKRQLEVYAYCLDVFIDNHSFPSLEEVAVYFDYSSVNSAYCHVKSLISLGLIEKTSKNGYKFTGLRLSHEQA